MLCISKTQITCFIINIYVDPIWPYQQNKYKNHLAVNYVDDCGEAVLIAAYTVWGVSLFSEKGPAQIVVSSNWLEIYVTSAKSQVCFQEQQYLNYVIHNSARASEQTKEGWINLKWLLAW